MNTELSNLLCSDKHILFVGIGNLLKSDDGIGVYIGQNIRKRNNIDALVVEMSIEKYVGAIEKRNPEIVVMIDAVDLELPPGEAILLEANEILDHTAHTHNISLSRIAEFFTTKVWVLGIQPKDLTYGEGFSAEVRAAADQLLQQINRD